MGAGKKMKELYNKVSLYNKDTSKSRTWRGQDLRNKDAKALGNAVYESH